MEKLEWNNRLNIGVEVIDKAHANLFRVVGKLTEVVKYETNYQNACKDGLRYLEDYTMQHFSEEEAYMRSIRYRGYEKHKQIHDHFRDHTLVSLKKTLELSNYSRTAVQRFLGTLLGWLTGHIMTEDQEITGERGSSKIYDNPSESAVVSQAVNLAMNNVFHLDAELVDADYHGRNMGTALYGRLCYDRKDGGKIQLLLGVEERLIRRGVGLLFGLPAMQDTAMVQEVSLQIFEQFLHYMGKLFKSETAYHLSKEELLSSDAFRSDFMTRYTCRMLFETRLGYFVFCSRQWHTKKKSAPAAAASSGFPSHEK